MVSFEFALPVPTTLIQLMLVLIGFTIGDWFSVLDWIIQQQKWFKEMATRSEVDAKLVKTGFDLFHHWQIGAILFFLPEIGSITFPGIGITINFGGLVFTVLQWIGVGIWGHDWKDFKHVMSRYKQSVSDGDEEPPEEPVPPGS